MYWWKGTWITALELSQKNERENPEIDSHKYPPTDFHEDAKAISHHTSNNLRMNHRRHWELSNYKECREQKEKKFS